MSSEDNTKKPNENALSSLRKLLQGPTFLPNELNTDDASLRNYLERTCEIPLPPSHRLIAFAEFMSKRLKWKQICDVFEFILKTEEADERNGTYAVWLTKSEDLLSSNSFSEEERAEIVQDLISIFDRALTDTPQNAGLALGLGTNYLRTSARLHGDTEHISQAVAWLNRAIEWLPPPNEQDHVQKYIYANINLRLGQCYMLLRVYKLALEHLKTASRGLLLGGEELSELVAGIDRCTVELGATN